jgi:NAD(P)-dependent dehydrogenase (short-subunit alcohol dehydrogenase family)
MTEDLNLVGRLSGKVALVTGGTSGIGAATVEQFVAEGAKVAALGRDAKAGEALVERLGSATLFIPGDVTREAEIGAAVAQTCAWGGRLDVLFNNAGGLTHGGVDSFTNEDFEHAMNLILRSALAGIKYAAPIMKAQAWGAIINNSSVGALRTHMGGYLYSIAKAGVAHATRLAGMELGRYGVTVNSISPGAVATPLFFGGSRVASHMQPAKTQAILSRLVDGLAHATPMARAGLPSDIATAAVFLASDEGHYINCHDLVVDGGQTAGGRSTFDPEERFDPFGGAPRGGGKLQ